ncbi:MAG: GNAT family N-acetyltransferase [Candidatus Hydrogenedentes bacterium]|nr:GNAT family N-acetyltransferase [Candidatus Hydrogenedentota bacterium]
MALKARVYIRRAEREDLDTVVSWREDPAFIRFLYGDRTRSPKQIREQIVGMLGRTAGHTMPNGIFLVVDSEKSGPIGLLSIVNIGWRNRSCNIDTYVVEKVRNSFLAAISFYRVLEYCFQELGMHRVNLFVYAFNARSWRVIERSGAKRELLLREHVARDGEVYDMYGYGLLRADWEWLREDFKSHFKGIDLLSMVAQRKQAAAVPEAAP